ncbi:MAG: putative glycosyltransferase EpsE [Candidatus Parcubacteria bacterium]|jgi:glycosyltransferase involved in cell wall biosynthesis
MTNPLINKSPILSIILPAYNAATYIAETIESVLHQDYTNFELLIIDDGSTDTTAQVVHPFTSDQRVIYIKNEYNIGLIQTLNKGISLAKGKYIGRIDADDIWHNPHKISMQMEYFDIHPDTVLLGTSAIAIDQDGTELFDMNYISGERTIRNRLLSGNQFIHPSVIFSKEIALGSGGFLPEDIYVEDYGLWLRMGTLGHIDNIALPLMKYRIHGSGVSQKNAVLQTRQSLMVTKPFKYLYGGYWKGRIKWHIKLFVLQLKGLRFINAIKNTIRRFV